MGEWEARLRSLQDDRKSMLEKNHGFSFGHDRTFSESDAEVDWARSNLQAAVAAIEEEVTVWRTLLIENELGDVEVIAIGERLESVSCGGLDVTVVSNQSKQAMKLLKCPPGSRMGVETVLEVYPPGKPNLTPPAQLRSAPAQSETSARVAGTPPPATKWEELHPGTRVRHRYLGPGTELRSGIWDPGTLVRVQLDNWQENARFLERIELEPLD